MTHQRDRDFVRRRLAITYLKQRRNKQIIYDCSNAKYSDIRFVKCHKEICIILVSAIAIYLYISSL